jgi:outer membrane protein TolC
MAQTDYRLAETNLFNALYELLIAKIDLEKSKGNLK